MNKKDLKRGYKQTLRPMGVYQIRNLVNEKVFIGSAFNLDGVFSKNKSQLDAGIHLSKSLQTDWDDLGTDNFVFEILEEFSPRENLNLQCELFFLEDLWFEKSEPYGDKGYNERKKTREERLQMIAANKLK
ncbi:MAG: GIY-YIG nuclease family protein [Acidobacteriota bacterium]|nr:GIY-YIG nuclease family protein [Acidobacteriota bacterium]